MFVLFPYVNGEELVGEEEGLLLLSIYLSGSFNCYLRFLADRALILGGKLMPFRGRNFARRFPH